MVVMKFGGTSVGTASAMRQAMQIVAGESRKAAPLVVLSACSGMTNLLIGIAEASGESRLEEAMSMASRLREHHSQLVSELITDDVRRNSVLERVQGYADELEMLIKGVHIVGELTPRTFDVFCSFGELLSTTIFAAALEDRGHSCRWVDVRKVMITDRNFGTARPLEDVCEKQVSGIIKPVLDEGTIVVTQGFIGATEDGKTTTMGRGGSDFTAALLGSWLPSEGIQIWTDVDGVMTCDPRIVPEARSIRVLTFSEAAELAYLGAKVLHPDTIAPAVKRNIPVYVLNSHMPEAKGTVITNDPAILEGMSYGGLVKSIAVKKGQCIVNFRSNRMLGRHGFLIDFFNVFAMAGVSVEMISTSEVSVSLTVSDTKAVDGIASRLSEMGEVELEHNVATVSVVGDNLRMSRGVSGRIFSALKDVNVRMISQGASEINVGFVVEEHDVPRALQNLHHEFFTDESTCGIFDRPSTTPER
ncbi:MAG: lysine-sensitive aspartokinase 3 [Prosthecochloris sp.]|jgi:aspartate kinase|nr:lysine-sensitive aspartokinase 3 [Prosthecochloris sp.]